MLIVAIRYIIASLLSCIREYHTFSQAVKSGGKKEAPGRYGTVRGFKSSGSASHPHKNFRSVVTERNNIAW
jgi:hypothetical protein